MCIVTKKSETLKTVGPLKIWNCMTIKYLIICMIALASYLSRSVTFFFCIIKCKVQQSIRKSIFFKTKRKKNRKNWFFESWKVHTHQWTEYSVIRHTRSLACVTNETVRSNTRKRLSTPNGVRSYIQLKFFQIRIRASKNQQ